MIPEYDEVMSEPEKIESEDQEEPEEQLQTDNKDKTNQSFKKYDDGGANSGQPKNPPVSEKRSAGRGL